MARVLLPLIVMLAGMPALASPAAAVAAALEDARKLPPGLREQARYLWHPGGMSASDRAVLSFHCNSLSREAELIQPRRVNDSLLAVNLLDYGWSAATWDKLADAEPYFSVRIVAARQFWRAGIDSRGQRFAAGWYANTKQEIIPAAAPWLDSAEITELITLTQSPLPIVRADWFLATTSRAESKTGYYDFIGIKNRADLEKLVGLDIKTAQRIRKEVAAIVVNSGVALNNRQIYRYQTIAGSWWVTLDVEQSTGENNAVRLLNGDFAGKHAAEEIYATLANGLPAYAASDAKGNLQKTVPDKIASDGTAGGNDRRIHPMKGCVSCHVEVIRPIDDWGRRAFRGELRLDVTDPQKFIRLRQLYLSDLDRLVKRDQADYADAIKRTNGLTSAANAKAYAAYFEGYTERSLGAADLAKEIGTTEARLLDGIRAQAAAGLFDPVLAGLLQKPPLPIRREHAEEIQPVLWNVMGNKP